MNKMKNVIIKFISKFTNKKIFVGQEVDIINTTPIRRKIQKTNSVTPIYKIREDIGYFELYGTIRSFNGATKYKLVHRKSNTNLVLSEELFNSLFEKENI